MSVQSDIGPALPPPGVIYQQAREIMQLALRASEFSRRGPKQDLALARQQFDAIRAIVVGEP